MEIRHIKTICPTCFGTLDKGGYCLNCKTWERDCETDPAALTPKTLLKGRYLVGKTLGIGGFGITYLAWDMHICQKVAIKEFFPKGYTARTPRSSKVTASQHSYTAAYNHWLTAFKHEAATLTQIKHLHGIVKLIEFFEENNTAYIVMDYLEGVSIRHYLNLRGGKIPYQEALGIMRPVMDSLLLVHQYGIIHKDISPENIIVVQNKYVKLIDFGAAGFYKEHLAKPFIVLKAGFSPIEMYNTHMPQGPWSDIYEVGATIYNCITGTIPPESTRRAVADTIIRPSSFGAQIPLIVENCLMRSLSVDPSARYDNVGKFIQHIYGEILPKTITRP